MQYKEYGINNKDTIILLHGGGLSWWNYRDEAELLKDRYHVILPVLDGHGGCDRHFTSIEDNAAEIIDFIDKRFKGSVFLMGGLSLGGQILLEVLSKRKDITRYALVESANVMPSSLTGALLGPSLSLSYNLISNPSFAKAQFANLRIRDELFNDYFRDTRRIEKSDLISFMKKSSFYSMKPSLKENKAKVHIYAGAKDNLNVIRSAKAINALLPSSTLAFLPDMYHGQFSLNYPEKYVSEILKITKKD